MTQKKKMIFIFYSNILRERHLNFYEKLPTGSFSIRLELVLVLG